MFVSIDMSKVKEEIVGIVAMNDKEKKDIVGIVTDKAKKSNKW